MLIPTTPAGIAPVYVTLTPCPETVVIVPAANGADSPYADDNVTTTTVLDVPTVIPVPVASGAAVKVNAAI